MSHFLTYASGSGQMASFYGGHKEGQSLLLVLEFWSTQDSEENHSMQQPISVQAPGWPLTQASYAGLLHRTKIRCG